MNETNTDLQRRIILERMKEGRSITSLEAVEEYGFTRLAAIICQLRKLGYNIRTERIKVLTRHGRYARVARYTLIEEAA